MKRAGTMQRDFAWLVMAVVLVVSACAVPSGGGPASTSTRPTMDTQTAQVEPAVSPEPVALKLGVLNFMSNSPFFIAAEEGYFSEQGLAVELVSFGTSDRDMIPALFQGQLDVALTTVATGMLNGIAQGGRARYVADKGFLNPQAACAADAVVVRSELLSDGRLGSASDIGGLTVTFSSANSFEYAVDLLLEKGHLTRDDVEIVEIQSHASRVEAMASGTLDLTAFSEPWITRGKDTGTLDVWMPLSELLPNMSIGTVIYGPSMLDRDPDVGVRFLVAYLKAIDQYNQGPTDRNVEIISKYTELPAEELREVCWPSYRPDGTIAGEPLLAFQEWALGRGYLDRVLSMEEVWDPQFVNAAYAIVHR